MEYKVNKPIAFIIFNRPDLTRLVFEQIRKVQPDKLFVIADGPRNENEKKLTDQTRAIIDEVDWDCEVIKNYSDKKHGGQSAKHVFECPVSRASMELLRGSFYCPDSLLAYPVIDGVPCLTENHAIVATHFEDRFDS